MSITDDEMVSNPSTNETLESVIDARLSRRTLLRGGLATAGAAVAFTGTDALVRTMPVHADGQHHHGYGKGYGRPAGTPLLGFEGVAPSSEDTVIVPPGYRADVLIAWGDPVSNGPAFRQDASNTAEEQAEQWGMHNDGLVFFPLNGSSSHGLIVQNHEYTDDGLLFPDGIANWDANKTAKSQNANGVGIIEVKRRRGRWEVVRPSRYARRITAQTPIEIAGPAAGHPLLQTNADPAGTTVLGTLNNCAMGYTPWGTYLTCEENFNGYFLGPAATPGTIEARYGIGNAPVNRWHNTDTRFSLAAEPNEPNRFGWVCEINPFDRNSTPVKRTALGRIKHEGAWVQEARDGRVVVYMGDDERFEYIYRYVSRQPWRKSLRQGINPLDDGTLYVARFDANGTGEWLPLTPDNPALAGWSLGEILVNTRTAADLAGATKMDRPEWIDTYPEELMAVATLTNNDRRGVGTNPGVDAANPRVRNVYGHIIRWGYDVDFTGPTFWWDIFALAGDRDNATHGSTVNGDAYGSPDGLYVAPSGRMWIQTDVSSSTINSGDYVGFGNNQMLCADPTTRRTRRFLVGPNTCEITGCFATPDETTLFVGIQHPGERPDSQPGNPLLPKEYSSWPDGDAGGRPRSALLVITKDDGGEIGS
jgi:secreted PhoX family phosphatase